MRDAAIEVDFGDGTYRFVLRYGELMQLQERVNAGPAWILDRLLAPNAENRGWRVEDLSNIVRLGLIGGGLEPNKALGLVRSYVEARPSMESLNLAIAILSAALVGAPDEASKKKTQATAKRSRGVKEASGRSARSSAQPQPSA